MTKPIISRNCKKWISPFFAISIGQQNLSNLNEIINIFYTYFSAQYVLTSSDERSRTLEQIKENITSKFYEDYIRYVFGYDKKTKLVTKCLLGSLHAPENTSEKDRRLFVITLMSRLIFIKFLEDKGLVRSPFITHLQQTYKSNNIPLSFYRTYLQPLFYEVLNTPVYRRKQNIISVSEFTNVPYLNGGLFREVVNNEVNYDVDNDILDVIIATLEKYRFTLEDNDDALNPDILGLVFEKTINYLTGEGNDRQKDLGAYYTPDDVTTFIARETIQHKTFDIVKQYLREVKWKDSDIDQYTSLEDFLDNPPNNPKTVSEIYERIKIITILDPGCGSGHFLTSAMKQLLRIHISLLSSLGKEVNLFEIKKNIVTKSLFGVDIENSAVEIARLRLWLNLIEDLGSGSINQIETLPNIEYNVDEGNSLIGFASPLKEEQKIVIGENTSSKQIFQDIDNLKRTYRMSSDPKEFKELKNKIEEKINNWNGILNQKFSAFLASDYKSRFSLNQIEQMDPFHWRLKFSEVFDRFGGFDIIIGNPPYIERSKLDYPTLFLQNDDCGNTYAYFFEVSLNNLKKLEDILDLLFQV
jgi:SAM-dependent methyltransferase